MKVAIVPEAAASVGVATPNTMTPITAKIINPIGTKCVHGESHFFPKGDRRDGIVWCAGRSKPRPQNNIRGKECT